MRNFLSSLITAFAIVFSIPTTLILVTWNSLPGETLYPVKTGLEDVALFLTVHTPIGSAFSINFTQRRFTEANRLLAKEGSSVGYNYLVNEARESKEIIVNNSDYKNAQELVKKIEDYQKALEEKKIAIQIAPSSVLPSVTPGAGGANPTPFPTATATPTHTLTVQVTSVPTSTAIPTPIPSPQAESPEEVVENLEHARQELEDIKEDIKNKLPSQASERAVEVHEDSPQERGRGR